MLVHACMMYTYRFALDGEIRLEQCFLYTLAILKSDETKSAWSPCFSICHQGGIHDFAKLREKLAEFFFIHVRGNTTHEDFFSLVLLFTGNCTLGINLIKVMMYLSYKLSALSIYTSHVIVVSLTRLPSR